jgi:hypothetical protein
MKDLDLEVEAFAGWSNAISLDYKWNILPFAGRASTLGIVT